MRPRRSTARFLSATAIPAVVFAVLVLMPLRVRAVAPELSFLPIHLRFGNVVVGDTETLVVVATNHGQSKVTISSVNANQSEVKISHATLPQALAAGESFAITLTFAPTVKGWRDGAITLVSDANDPILTVVFEGTGVAREEVTVSPANLAFGNVGVGASSKLPVVLTNTTPRDLTIPRVRTQGPGFSVSGATFPLTLAAGKKLNLEVTFKPQTVGPAGGSSFVAGPSVEIPFTGFGVSVGTSKPELAIIPAKLNFGDVAVGTTEKRTIELSASGGDVTVSSASSSSSQFAVLDPPLPLKVSVGNNVSLNVAFTPQASGQPAATLSFASDAADSPAHSALIGTGTVAFVSLSWNASTSTEVTGYNIYRKASSTGSYTRINSKLDPNTNYTDATVTHGTTYYYATTAVNSKGKESEYSNGVQVVVP